MEGGGIFKTLPWPVEPISNANPCNDAAMPPEWEKANKALQAVLKTRSPKVESNESTSVARQQQPQAQQSPGGSVNYASFPYWPQQVFYPGYPNMGYPGYGFYNMNAPPYNGFYSMPPTMPLLPNPAMGINAPNMSNKKDSSENVQTNNVESNSQKQFTPTPDSTTENNSFRFNQAPGAGGIRFSLPKQKQNKMNNFRGYQNNVRQQRPLNNFGNRLSFMNSAKNDSNQPSSPKDKNKISGFDLKTGDFPPALQKYIADSFAKCKTDLDKDLIEITLKGKLTKAVRDKEIFTKDWSKEPLPTIHSERIGKTENDNDSFIPLKIGSGLKFNKFNKISPKQSINQRSQSSSRSSSRSRSRSASPYTRRVVRRRKHSSDSSSSSSDNRKVSKLSPVNTSERGSNKWLNRLGKKKNKKKKKHMQVPFTIDSDLASDDRLQKRAARFESSGKRDSSIILTINNNSMPIDESSDIDWSSYAIIGTNQDIEKSFFRLTGAVDPSTIRPVEVLVKSLQNVKDNWVEKQDYHYACDQLKSIRQDLLVQCIRDSFTIQAYETHARIALEKGDHTEFNQCQSQLRMLYDEVKEGNRQEFTGYRILYNIFSQNSREIKNILTALSLEEKQDEVISHALKLNQAWALNNFHQFFKLYRVAPKMSGFIIDWFLNRERVIALKIIIKSYRPTLPVAYVAIELGFDSDTKCVEFLQEAKCLLSNDHSAILCKESVSNVFSTST